jgi:hypothetical protein
LKDRDNEELIEVECQPTWYAGITFRSQLEALWALFFDSIGWSYKYEPHQFDLGKYRYTPDFLFPGLDIFIEIKPNDQYGKRASMTTEEIATAKEKCRLLEQKTKKRVLLIRGNPTPSRFSIFSDQREDNYCSHQEFAECLTCGAIYLQSSNRDASSIETKDTQKNCECPNIVPFSSPFLNELTQLGPKAVEEDNGEIFEVPLDVNNHDNPANPNFVDYRYNELMLNYIEKGVGDRIKKAFLRTHKLKDNPEVIHSVCSEDKIKYGGESDDNYETKKLTKDLYKNILKSFPFDK